VCAGSGARGIGGVQGHENPTASQAPTAATRTGSGSGKPSASIRQATATMAPRRPRLATATRSSWGHRNARLWSVGRDARGQVI